MGLQLGGYVDLGPGGLSDREKRYMAQARTKDAKKKGGRVLCLAFLYEGLHFCLV